MDLKSLCWARRTWLLCVMALAALGCHRNISSALPAPDGSSGEAHLVLLHTNDIHAAVAPRVTPTGLRGGFAALDGQVRQIRAEAGPENVLLLDGGDLMTGGPASETVWEDVPGGALFTLMGQVGYDAWTLGNHELDGGLPPLEAGISLLPFPTLCSNLRTDRDRPLFRGVKPWTVLERGGLTIGVVGLMTRELGRVLSPSRLDGLALHDPIDQARAAVEVLDARTDLVVVLSHQGVDDDRRLAEAVGGIDVIVGGHSHTRLDAPLRVGGARIVQAGAYLQELGRLDLWVRPDGVVTDEYHLLPLDAGGPPASPEVEDLLTRLDVAVDATWGEVLATLATPWESAYGQESNVGDWLTDRLREATGADLAVLNSGGIRQGQAAGPLTLGDLRAIYPFDNPVATFRLDGAGLEALALHNARAAASGGHGILQISGFAYRWRRVEGQVQLVDLRVGGAPVSPTDTFEVASNTYIVFDQPTKYLGAVPHTRQTLDFMLFDVLTSAARAAGTIDARVEGRIQEVP